MRILRAACVVLPLTVGACSVAPRQAILREQDLRAKDSRPLKEAASSQAVESRRAALMAMGRIQSEAYLKSLLMGLSDPEVAEAAVFSLGQLGMAEPALSSSTLATAAIAVGRFSAGVSGSAKRAAVESLGKVGGPQEEPRLVDLLRDPDPLVRGEAALALFRQRFLKRVPEYSTAAVSGMTSLFGDPDKGVHWRAVYPFSRFPEPRAAKALARAVLDNDPTARLFACRALAQLKTGAPTANLVAASLDPDSLVRTEAVRALGLAGRADLIGGAAYGDPSAHVRAAAADALAASGDAKLASRLDKLVADGSPMVKAQALLAVPRLRPQTALGILESERSDPRWWVRSRAYLAMGGLDGAQGLLRQGLGDPDQRVAAAAVEAMAKSSSTEVVATLDSILRDPKASLELVGSAIEAAGSVKSIGLDAALMGVLRGELAKKYPELADDIAEAIKAIREAHPELENRELARRPKADIVITPDLSWAPAPAIVVLETDKGDIEIAVAAEEAPLHAASFLRSVRGGLYDGTIWHRVVSGFVVQGGDPRGSGWGDAGFSLRDEINRLPFQRGTVGMPKAGKDTGGCQLFITHLPTPHLDGRYTVFGRVVSGMEAVDRLEPGDRIRRARLK